MRTRGRIAPIVMIAAGLTMTMTMTMTPAQAAPLKPAASTLYVAPSGSNTSNCTTSRTPCLTITYALGQLPTAGGTIKVGAGTYHEQVNINVPVTLVGSGASSTFIDGTNVNIVYPDYALVNIGDVNATVKGFTIQNAGMSSLGEAFLIDVQAKSPHTVTITQNSIVGSDPANTYPIGVYESTNGNVNVSQNAFSNLYQGVFLENGGEATITQNTFSGLFNDGIYAPAGVFILAHNQATVSNQAINQNTFSGYAGWGIVLEAGYPYYGDLRDQGTIQGASVNQNRFTLGAVPIAEVDGPKAPAAIGLIGHTAAETFGTTESRVTASLSQNRGTVTGPTMALYVRQPVTYTESKDKIAVLQ
jgi:hypothetical protein